MARIQTYDAPVDKLSPSSEGNTAWEQAGRRLGPAYNEAGRLLGEGARMVADAGRHNIATGKEALNAGEDVVRAGELGVQAGNREERATAALATVTERLNSAILSQYKDLFDIGIEGERVGRGGGGGGSGGGGSGGGGGAAGGNAAAKAARGINWGGLGHTPITRGGYGGYAPDYGAASEINSGGYYISKLYQAEVGKAPGGKEINVAAGYRSPNSKGFWTNDDNNKGQYYIPSAKPYVPTGDQDFSGGERTSGQNIAGGQVYWGPIGPNQSPTDVGASAKGNDTYGGPPMAKATPYQAEPSTSPWAPSNWGNTWGAVTNWLNGQVGPAIPEDQGSSE